MERENNKNNWQDPWCLYWDVNKKVECECHQISYFIKIVYIYIVYIVYIYCIYCIYILYIFIISLWLSNLSLNIFLSFYSILSFRILISWLILLSFCPWSYSSPNLQVYIFVAASHQTGLDTRSKARRPLKVGIKGRERSGMSRDSNPAGLCCSLTH